MDFSENPLKAIYDELISQREEIKQLRQRIESKAPKSRQGGMELAIELTGYTRSTINKKAAAGEFPVRSEKYAPIWVDEEEVKNYMKAKARKPKEQIQAEAMQHYATIKRARS